MKQFIKCVAVLLLIILVDQATKLWVYHHMELGAEGQINICGNVLKLTYILNPGMACSIHLGFKYGKLLITTFRIFASLCIFWYIIQNVRQKVITAWIWGWIFVLGGAIGNTIDSIFYGVYLHNAPADAPMKWLYGQVIDMIHIDLWSGVMPNWLPIWGGYEIYCLPVFNIADVAICFGLLIVLYSSHSEMHTKMDHELLMEDGHLRDHLVKG